MLEKWKKKLQGDLSSQSHFGKIELTIAVKKCVNLEGLKLKGYNNSLYEVILPQLRLKK